MQVACMAGTELKKPLLAVIYDDLLRCACGVWLVVSFALSVGRRSWEDMAGKVHTFKASQQVGVEVPDIMRRARARHDEIYPPPLPVRVLGPWLALRCVRQLCGQVARIERQTQPKGKGKSSGKDQGKGKGGKSSGKDKRASGDSVRCIVGWPYGVLRVRHIMRVAMRM